MLRFPALKTARDEEGAQQTKEMIKSATRTNSYMHEGEYHSAVCQKVMNASSDALPTTAFVHFFRRRDRGTLFFSSLFFLPFERTLHAGELRRLHGQIISLVRR